MPKPLWIATSKIDIELVASAAEASLKRYPEAGKRLDDLLKTVAPDYWRRPEIVSRRVNLLRTDAAREKMLTAGTISLQAESHPCAFRNIRLKPLEK